MAEAGELVILRLLEQGKITPAEAADLLRALGNGKAAEEVEGAEERAGWPGEAAIHRAIHRASARARQQAKFWAQNADELTNRAVADAGRAVEQMGETISRVFSGVPDLVERATQSGWGPRGSGFLFEEEFEGRLEGEEDQPAGVDVEGWNGRIVVHAIDGDRYRVVLRKRIFAASESVAQAIAETVHRSDTPGRQVTVRRDPQGGPWIGSLGIELFLPRSARWGGLLSTSNGPIQADGLTVDGLRLETTNGAVRCSGVRGGSIQASSANGRIDLAGRWAHAEMRTTNGMVTVSLEEPDGEAEVNAVTSNGPIEVHLPVGVPLDLTATTSNGRLDADVVTAGARRGFGRNEFRWTDPAWTEATKRVRLWLRTSNGSIRLV